MESESVTEGSSQKLSMEKIETKFKDQIYKDFNGILDNRLSQI